MIDYESFFKFLSNHIKEFKKRYGSNIEFDDDDKKEVNNWTWCFNCDYNLNK